MQSLGSYIRYVIFLASSRPIVITEPQEGLKTWDGGDNGKKRYFEVEGFASNPAKIGEADCPPPEPQRDGSVKGESFRFQTLLILQLRHPTNNVFALEVSSQGSFTNYVTSIGVSKVGSTSDLPIQILEN